MKITSITKGTKRTGQYLAIVTGLKSTVISVQTEQLGDRIVVTSASSSTGPGSRGFNSFNWDRNAKMLAALELRINAIFN